MKRKAFLMLPFLESSKSNAVNLVTLQRRLSLGLTAPCGILETVMEE
jgi:hypothetical protein